MNGSKVDNHGDQSDLYKQMYEASKRGRKADAEVTEARERRWIEASKALMIAAETKSADSWRRACKLFLTVAEEERKDIAMLEGMILMRDEMRDKADREEIERIRELRRKAASAFDFDITKQIKGLISEGEEAPADAPNKGKTTGKK
jgi:hypothetical protein